MWFCGFFCQNISAMNCGNSRQFDKLVSVLNRIAVCAQLRDDIRSLIRSCSKTADNLQPLFLLYLGCHFPGQDYTPDGL